MTARVMYESLLISLRKDADNQRKYSYMDGIRKPILFICKTNLLQESTDGLGILMHIERKYIVII